MRYVIGFLPPDRFTERMQYVLDGTEKLGVANP